MVHNLTLEFVLSLFSKTKELQALNKKENTLNLEAIKFKYGSAELQTFLKSLMSLIMALSLIVEYFVKEGIGILEIIRMIMTVSIVCLC
jgi:preprotein translocase subunit Sec63